MLTAPPTRDPHRTATLRRLLVVGVSVIGAVCMVLVVVVAFEAWDARHALEHGEDQAEVIGLISRQQAHLLEISSAHRGFVLTRDERALDDLPETIDDLERGFAEIRAHLQRHPGSDVDGHLARSTALTDAAHRKTRSYLDEWVLPRIEQVRAGKSAQIIDEVLTGPGVRNRIDALAHLDELRELETAEEVELERSAGRKFTLATIGAVGSLLFVFMLIVAAAVVFRRRIIAPVLEAANVAQRIASGESRLRVGPTGIGEIGQLTLAIDQMADAAETNEATLVQRNRQLDATRNRLEQDQTLLQAVLEATPAAACLFDADGILKLSNRPETRLPSAAFVADPTDGTIETSEADGRWYRRFTRLLTSPDGSNLGRIVIVDDITAEKVADQAKADLISTVSHEMRTPLTAVMGYAEALARGPADSEQVRRYASTISREANRLTRLVSDLLDLQRIEGAGLTLELTRFDLYELLREQVGSFHAHDGAQRLAFRVPVSEIMVVADRDRVGQVVGNLIANALKYSTQGMVTVDLALVDRRAVIAVHDRGIGISDGDLPHVFDRFYRGATGALGPVRGSGLGLAVAQEIVRAHGGTITVESHLGVGSTFRFDLPLTPPG